MGVDNHTVATQREKLEAGEEIPHVEKAEGSDGKKYPRKSVSVFNPTKREEKAMANPEVVERMQEDGINPLAASRKVANEAKAERKAYELAPEIPDDMCRCLN